MKECLSWQGHYAGAGEECEEEVAETSCDEPTAIPIFCPLHYWTGGREK